MQIITKNILWWALMDIYKAAKSDHSSNNLFWHILLMEQCPEHKKEKKKE